ncbi:hypothetical protein I3843_04G057100 [Carya illinoinensis]|nr:hypothetical protein I3843_04G057100 [Carya illinoinensis]
MKCKIEIPSSVSPAFSFPLQTSQLSLKQRRRSEASRGCAFILPPYPLLQLRLWSQASKGKTQTQHALSPRGQQPQSPSVLNPRNHPLHSLHILFLTPTPTTPFSPEPIEISPYGPVAPILSHPDANSPLESREMSAFSPEP